MADLPPTKPIPVASSVKLLNTISITNTVIQGGADHLAEALQQDQEPGEECHPQHLVLKAA